jgi:predicted SprT family Zn-dependent metalloprotease
MRMILPTLQERRSVDRHLTSFFRDYRASEFKRAVSTLCKFYGLKMPKVEWYEYIDWGKTAGKTYENGHIHLVHPENWKRGRKYNSERKWVNTVYHELGHYIFWADAEHKADNFAFRMVRGLNHHR